MGGGQALHKTRSPSPALPARPPCSLPRNSCLLYQAHYSPIPGSLYPPLLSTIPLQRVSCQSHFVFCLTIAAPTMSNQYMSDLSWGVIWVSAKFKQHVLLIAPMEHISHWILSKNRSSIGPIFKRVSGSRKIWVQNGGRRFMSNLSFDTWQ